MTSIWKGIWKGMPLNIISYKEAIWKGIEGHLKGIVQKLEDRRNFLSESKLFGKGPSRNSYHPELRKNICQLFAQVSRKDELFVEYVRLNMT